MGVLEVGRTSSPVPMPPPAQQCWGHSFYTLIWENPENLSEGEFKTNFAGERIFKTR